MNRHSPASPAFFRLRPIAFGVALACCEAALANPVGPQVTAGAASFHSAGKTLSVTNAPGTIINWQGFSIGSGEHTRFNQQSAASAVLNRVVGGNPSELLGALTSNGRVFLVNPHGIVFGAGSRIDTAGFIASTLNIADSDFLHGRLKFEGGGHGVLRNDGVIRASGDIMLVGPAIENAGSIVSDHGSVLLAAGRKVTITSPDAQGVRFELQAPTDSALNVGTIDAASSAAMFAGTLRHSGDIRATGATVSEGGKVSLVAQKEAFVDKGATITASGLNGGAVTVQSGDLTMVSGHVAATGSAGHGGTVQVLGNRVALSEGASIDASGETGGGTILVGGDYQGGNAEVQNAWRTYVSADSTLRADALASGDGGKVIVWADDINRYHGHASARGGAQSGDGGFVEVSGKRVLDFDGTVDTRAPNGQAGTLLLDPTTINIVDPGSGGTPDTPFLAGVFADVANDESEITVTVLRNALVMSDVTINTNSAALLGEGDINFNTAFDYDGIGTRTLSLVANRDVNFLNPISDGAGAGDRLNLSVNAGGVTNIAATIDLRGGTFNATAGSGVVNMLAGNPAIQDAAAFSAGTLNLGGGVATSIDAPVSLVNLNVSSGSLSTSGNIEVAGTLNWPGGTLTGPGLLETLPSSTSNVTGLVALLEKTWENSGTVNFSGAGALLLSGAGSPSRLVNQPVGIVNLTSVGDKVFTAGPVGAKEFTNSGNVVVNAPGPVTISAPFSNAGVVSVPTQSLILTGGGTDTGSYALGAGTASLRVQGGVRNFNAGVSFSGAGTLIINGGTVNVNSPFTQAAGTPQWMLAGGQINAPAALTFNDNLIWSGGSITGVGLLTTNADTSIEPLGTAVLLNKQWANAGTLTVRGELRLIGYPGTPSILTNTGSVVINPMAGSSGSILGVGTSAFVNNSALQKNVFSTSTIDTPFTNTGSVIVSEGTLRLMRDGSDTGTYSIDAGAVLEIGGGARSFSAASAPTGPGTLRLSGGTLDVLGGALGGLDLTGGSLQSSPGDLTVGGVFNISGGEILAGGGGDLLTPGLTTVSGSVVTQRDWLNSGAVEVFAGGAVTMSGSRFTNNGVLGGDGTINTSTSALVNQSTIRPGSTIPGTTGTLTINGDFEQNAAGTLEIELGGTADSQFDRLLVSGNAQLDGTLAVSRTSAAVALPSDSSYTIMTYGTRSGDFAAVTFPTGYDTFAAVPNALDYTLTLGAVTNRWLAGSGVWNDQTGWNLGHVPTAGEDALIDVAGSQTITLTAPNQQARSLTSSENLEISAGGLTLGPLASTVSGDVNVFGGLLTLGGAFTAGALGVSGGEVLAAGPLNVNSLAVSGGSATTTAALTANSVSVSGGLLTIADTVSAASISLSGGVLNAAGGTLPRLDMSGGSLARFTGGDVTIAGPFNASGGSITSSTGAGDLMTSGVTTITGPVSSQRAWRNSGTLQIDSGATLATGDNPFTNSGVLGGAGTLAAATVTNEGTVRPGSTVAGNVGTLSITGNYAQSATGRLEADLAGTGAGQADLLAVSGSAALDGTLAISHIDGFAPPSDSSYVVLTSSAIDKDFQTRTVPTGYSAFYSAAVAPTSYRVSLGTVVNSWVGGSGFWQSGDNWSLVHAPTAGEDALIDVSGALANVTVSSGSQRARKLTSFENVIVSGGELTLGPLDSKISAALTVAGGSLVATGALDADTINLSSGSLDVQSGTLPRLNMSGGVLTRSIDGNLTIAGPFNVSGGFIAPSAGFGDLLTAGATTVTGAVTTSRNWSNSGVLDLNGEIVLSSANFTNDPSGIFNLNGEGRMGLNGAVLTNRGIMSFNVAGSNTGPLGPGAAGALLNSGVVLKNGTGGVFFVHPFTNAADGVLNVNAGTLTVAFNGASQAGAIEIAQGATLGTNGDLTNAPGASIGGAGLLQLGGGTLTNAGSLFPGTLAGPPGTLTIGGNLTNTESSSVNVRLMGSGPEQLDRLAVLGSAALAGTLNVFTSGGYTATDGDAFTVLRAGAVSGAFTSVNKTFAKPVVTAYGPRSLSLSINSPALNFWEFDSSGSWNDASRWSLGHVPLATEQVRIDQPGVLTISMEPGSYAVDRLRSQENISLGGTLDLANASAINALLAISGGTLQGTGALNLAMLSLENGTIASTGGVNVRGTTSVGGASRVLASLTTNGFAMTSGTLGIGANGVLNLVGSADKSMTGGTLTNEGMLDVQSGAFTTSGFPVNNGTVRVGEGAMLRTSGAALVNAAGGLVKGGGAIVLDGATLTNEGVVAPGDSPGVLTIDGNFVQGPGGTLAIEVGGVVQGVDYDLLNITGSASLDGTLALSTVASTPIRAGSTYDVMAYESRSGDFATVTRPEGVTLQPNPGPTAYRLQTAGMTPQEARETQQGQEAQSFTTRDALVFNEHLVDRFSDVGNNDLSQQQEREKQGQDTLPECR